MRWIAPFVCLTACVTQEMPTEEDGARLFADNCVACHGRGGTGDGPLAAELRPRPANLTNLFVRGYDRTRVLSVIDGYQRAGHTAMPEFGAVLASDTVPVELDDGRLSPVPRQLAALLFYLESIQEDAP